MADFLQGLLGQESSERDDGKRLQRDKRRQREVKALLAALRAKFGFANLPEEKDDVFAGVQPGKYAATTNAQFFEHRYAAPLESYVRNGRRERVTGRGLTWSVLVLGSATTLFGAISTTGGQDWASWLVVAIGLVVTALGASSDVFQPAARGRRHQLLSQAFRDAGWRALNEDWMWERFRLEVVAIRMAFPTLEEPDLTGQIDEARKKAAQALHQKP